MWPVQKKRNLEPFEARTYRRFDDVPEFSSGIVDGYYVAKAHLDSPVVLHFNGAINHDKYKVLPVYHGWSWFRNVDASFVHTHDEMITAENKLPLAWYIGGHLVDLMEKIRDSLRGMLGGRRVDLAVGTSSGGFAAFRAVQIGIADKGLAVNPQTDILKYHRKWVRHYLEQIWNGDSRNSVLAMRKDLLSFIGRERPGALFYYYQNEDDVFHFKNHYVPFRDAVASHYKSEPSPWNFTVYSNAEFTHHPPPEEIFTQWVLHVLGQQHRIETMGEKLTRLARKVLSTGRLLSAWAVMTLCSLAELLSDMGCALAAF